MALGMSRDRQRILISPADGIPGPQISFSPEDLAYVFRVCAGDVGGLDRIRLYFKRPIGLTGVHMAPGKDKLQLLILYYDYSMVGVTDEQMELLEGMKKRKAEEPVEDDNESPKKVKMLSGRPSRRAKEQALMTIANPMGQGVHSEVTPEMRMKRITVSRAVDAYMNAFRKVCPGARFSTFTMDAELSKSIQVTLPGVTQVMEDPLFLMPSDEGGELLLTSRWNVNSHNITIWASEVDFVLIAVENDEDDDGDGDDDPSVPEVRLDEEMDTSNFAMFMHLTPQGNVRTISVCVPTMVQLVQIRDWLKSNNIAYLSAMTSMPAVNRVDLAALCREKPEEFDVDLETKTIIGGPLDGFRPFEPYLEDSDDDEWDEDEEEKEMLKHAKKVAAMGNKNDLVETFLALPRDERTTKRLKQIFREAGLWEFLAERLDVNDSESGSDSEDDSDFDDEDEEEEEEEDDDDMLTHAKSVAAMSNKSELIETYLALPGEEQTPDRLEQIFREAGLWGFLADRLGNGDSDSEEEDED